MKTFIMNRHYFVLTGIILFGLIGFNPTPTSAGFLDFLGPEVTAICAGLTSLPAIADCASDFDKNLKEYSDAFNANQGGQTTTTTTTKVPEYTLCCQINILQSCIAKEIGSICGSQTEEAAKTLVKYTLKAAKYLANQVDNSGGGVDCDWDAWYFQKESPVCWPAPAQAAVILAINLLVILCCCWCCCRLCCRLCCRKTKAVQTTVFIPCTAGNFSVRPTNDPPYQPLGKSDV